MIRFPCAGCDKVMNAADEHAGKKAKCPSCSAIVVIPRRSTLPDTAAATPAPPKTAPSKPLGSNPGSGGAITRKPMPPPIPAKAKVRPVEEEDEDIPEVEAVEDDEEDEAPVKRKKRRRSNTGSKKYRGSSGASAADSSGFSYSIVGGLLMMILAVVWFVGGLMVDIIFFYPPILFILGFIAFIKGVVGGNIAGEG